MSTATLDTPTTIANPYLRRHANQTTYASSADALSAKGMNWGVRLEDLTTTSGQRAPARAVVRADTGKPLGVVGNRYATLDNVVACGWIDQYAPFGVQITGANEFKGGQRCSIHARVNGPAEVTKGDLVALELVANWSHDGSSGTTGFLRVIRLVCMNGACMATAGGRMFNIRHTVNADKPSADHIQAQVREALEKFGETVEVFRGLAARPADRANVREYVREVMAMEPDALGKLSTRSANTLDEIVARFDDSRAAASELVAQSQERERMQSASILDDMVNRFDGAGAGATLPAAAGTWWGAYNAVTDYLTHGRGSKPEARQESLLFGASRALNERALGAAMNRAGIA